MEHLIILIKNGFTQLAVLRVRGVYKAAIHRFLKSLQPEQVNKALYTVEKKNNDAKLGGPMLKPYA